MLLLAWVQAHVQTLSMLALMQECSTTSDKRSFMVLEWLYNTILLIKVVLVVWALWIYPTPSSERDKPLFSSADLVTLTSVHF